MSPCETTQHAAPTELRSSRWIGRVRQICRSYGAQEAPAGSRVGPPSRTKTMEPKSEVSNESRGGTKKTSTTD